MVFVFVFHIFTISISRSLYLLSFLNSVAERWHTHIYKLTRFALFMFDYYIWPVSLYYSVSSNGEVSENGGFWSIHNRKRFMFIPFVTCFNIIMVTDFPVYILSNTIMSVYSFWARIAHCEIRWSIVSVLVLQNLHLETAPSWRILDWKLLVKRLWSCATTINPSVPAWNLVFLSHWWVPCILRQILASKWVLAM